MFKINIYSEFLLGYVMKSSTLKWEHPEKQWSFKKKRRLIKVKNNIIHTLQLFINFSRLKIIFFLWLLSTLIKTIFFLKMYL